MAGVSYGTMSLVLHRAALLLLPLATALDKARNHTTAIATPQERCGVTLKKKLSRCCSCSPVRAHRHAKTNDTSVSGGLFGCHDERTIWTSGGCAGIFECGNKALVFCTGERCLCSVPSAECSTALASSSPVTSPPAAAEWSRRVVVVAAVFREWDHGLPPWACPSDSNAYTLAPLYTRVNSSHPRFVPNNGFEAGVYLRFIVDHYERLPEVAVFLQADAQLSLFHRNLSEVLNGLQPELLRSRAAGFLPLNVGRDLISSRNVSAWGDKSASDAVAACWRHVLAMFGRDEVFADPDVLPTVTFYPGAYFAVSRENIQRHPLKTWRAVYERLIVDNSCLGDGTVDPNHGKSFAAGAFEHLAHVIFGGSGASYKGKHWEEEFG